MRSLIRLILLAVPMEAAIFSYHIAGDETAPWPAILGSIGLQAQPLGPAGVLVVRAGAVGPAQPWLERAKQGAFVILEGESGPASELGFCPTPKRVAVRNVEDLRSPGLKIFWEKPLELPIFEVPAGVQVFQRERWMHAPLMAGRREGSGGLLWVAVTPGEHGYERFPYLLQALGDLGFTPPFRSRRLWAFFDSAYRARADLDFFAARWKEAGISALQVAAWHFFESGPEGDRYLRSLIEACHRRGIHVYAWLELPHVSEQFWTQHPEWREKTAMGQDAHLDWRKLMNLQNPDCARAVAQGIRELLDRFDWDGVNLAELYFESLEGYANPARFTPMNDDVRAAFQKQAGFDPRELFDPASAKHPAKEASGMRAFLEFRAGLAAEMQKRWVGEMEAIRSHKPDLDLVLTHIDDRFDVRMRDLLGADASQALPLLERHDCTFLIEDPATIWNLGPERYAQIAQRYQPLTAARDRLAIDINIVERYQEVYPTRQQTGIELLQLVRQAAIAFPRVALYFENSVLPVDHPLLGSAASGVRRVERIGGKWVLDSPGGVGVPWSGDLLVDGRPWPVRDDATVWLPPGVHSMEPGGRGVPIRLIDFNGTLDNAAVSGKGIAFSYRSSTRAFARFDREIHKIEIDGAETTPARIADLMVLPRGQHIVSVE